MDPRQHDVRRHRTDRDCLVLDLGNVVVGWPVVGHQPGVGGHGAKYESVDLVLAEALDYLQPGASRRAAVDFDRPCDQHLADPTAPRWHDDRVVLGTKRDGRLVSFDDATQRLTFRIDHSPAQLAAQHPGGSVRAQAELALQLQCRDAIGVRRHEKRGPEPDRQRQLAGVHDRAGGHRGLTATAGTLIDEGFSLEPPGAAFAAARTDKPLRPPTLEKVLRACALARKATLELDQRLWKPALRPRHGLTPRISKVTTLSSVLVLYKTFRSTGRSCIGRPTTPIKAKKTRKK